MDDSTPAPPAAPSGPESSPAWRVTSFWRRQHHRPVLRRRRLPLGTSPGRLALACGEQRRCRQHRYPDVIDRWPTSVRAKSPAAALIRIGTNAAGLAQTAWRAQYDALVALGIADGIKIIFHAVPPRRGTLVPRAMSDYLQAKAAASPGNVPVEDCTDCGDASYNALLGLCRTACIPTPRVPAMGVRMAPLLKGHLRAQRPTHRIGGRQLLRFAERPQYVKTP